MRVPDWLDGWAALAIAMFLGLFLFIAYLVPPLGAVILASGAAFFVIDGIRNRWFHNAEEAAKLRKLGGTPWGAVFLDTGTEDLAFLLLPGFSGPIVPSDIPQGATVYALPGVDSARIPDMRYLVAPVTVGVLKLRPHRGGVVGVWPGDRRVLVHPAARPSDLVEVRPGLVLGAFAPMSPDDLVALSRIVPELTNLFVLWWAALRPPSEAQVLIDLGANVQVIPITPSETAAVHTDERPT